MSPAKIILSVFIPFILSGSINIFQNTQDDITKAFREANHKNLAKHFNKEIELVIPGHENIYSKAQAEVIMKDFFSKNPVVSFTVQHSGGPKNARYSINLYETNKETFRIYYLLKNNGKGSFIHLLRIEKNK